MLPFCCYSPSPPPPNHFFHAYTTHTVFVNYNVSHFLFFLITIDPSMRSSLSIRLLLLFDTPQCLFHHPIKFSYIPFISKSLSLKLTKSPSTSFCIMERRLPSKDNRESLCVFMHTPSFLSSFPSFRSPPAVVHAMWGRILSLIFQGDSSFNQFRLHRFLSVSHLDRPFFYSSGKRSLWLAYLLS